MHTKDMLAEALRKAGLDEMAVLAEAGQYYDFLSDVPYPAMKLMRDLEKAAGRGNSAALLLMERHAAGEFDATVEEGDAWAASDDGQAAFRALLE